MQSQKPIFKKPFEHINTYEESTWLGNDKPFYETEFTGVFNDKYPCVTGHTLFIPKKNSPEYIGKTYGLAYEFGQRWVSEGKMSGYNVGMNIGRCAGQTVFWPHIHFIPRKNFENKVMKYLKNIDIFLLIILLKNLI